MAALTAAVWATYDDTTPVVPGLPPLDTGGSELVGGLTGAFAVRATIQRAIGILARGQRSVPARADVTLRLRAVDAEVSLLDTAHTIIAGHDEPHRPDRRSPG